MEETTISNTPRRKVNFRYRIIEFKKKIYVQKRHWLFFWWWRTYGKHNEYYIDWDNSTESHYATVFKTLEEAQKTLDILMTITGPKVNVLE